MILKSYHVRSDVAPSHRPAVAIPPDYLRLAAIE